MPGGPRRLANVRKLMRLAREHEAAHGSDLHDFLELVTRRARASGSTGLEARESEAPVEGEALDAIRLMTIHRAKGLEFDVVCVADLGRGPRWRTELVRVGRDGRIGLRLAEPGTGRRESALDYRTLGEERQAAEALEERRLFYVAMTRARERLILSGAAKLEVWPELEGNGGGGGPIAWIGPAVAERDDVAVAFVGPEDLSVPEPLEMRIEDRRSQDALPEFRASGSGREPAPQSAPAPPVTALSYTSLAEYQRCGYRFYAERVLRLPAGPRRGGGSEVPLGTLSATERGTLVHALLERLDFRRPAVVTEAAVAATAAQFGLSLAPGGADSAQIIELVDRFAAGELCSRLARATGVRREERFRFLLNGVLIGGVFDVIAREPGGRTLVVDYKTDRLEGADPQALADRAYGTQRLVYALAALKAGGDSVEVVHTFLELPGRPAVAHFTRDQLPALEAALGALAGGVLRREFTVTEAPHRGVCEGCPAEGALCSWPLEMTRREAADRLF
jgi:ATP-dependent exoDNAse (exonuclease V) beta subunit